MDSDQRRARGRAARDRLGLPDVAGQGQLTASLVVDSLGDGLFVPAARGGFGAALTDGAFMLIVATNLLFVLCALVLDVLLAVYLIRALHEPAWLAGLLFALNTAVVAAGQTMMSSAAGRLRPGRMLQLSAAIWATGILPRGAVIPVLFLAVLIFTAAEMVQGPALNDLVVAIAPEPVRGRYLGVYQLSWGAGSALAPALFSWLFSVGTVLPWTVLGLACAVWVILLGALARRLPQF
jgi:hypothetical protein